MSNQDRPDLDELMAQGMPLWRALEVWVATAHSASLERQQSAEGQPLSGLVDKPNTRLQ